MNWTFAICTAGGKDVRFHDEILASIRDECRGREHEIIFATENREFTRPDARVIYIGQDKPAWITRKKNELAKAATHECICYLHDYCRLGRGWLSGFDAFGDGWDVCCMKVLKPDSSRWWDWASLDAPGYGWCLLPYEVQGTKGFQYVSGTAFAVKRAFMLAHPLNEELTWDQGEDSEWSRRVRGHWRLELNTLSTVRLLRFPRT